MASPCLHVIMLLALFCGCTAAPASVSSAPVLCDFNQSRHNLAVVAGVEDTKVTDAAIRDLDLVICTCEKCEGLRGASAESECVSISRQNSRTIQGTCNCKQRRLIHVGVDALCFEARSCTSVPNDKEVAFRVTVSPPKREACIHDVGAQPDEDGWQEVCGSYSYGHAALISD